MTAGGRATPTLAAESLQRLRERGETVATAESLTAGLLCASFASIPGASDCLRGGLAAYATDVKTSVLGVDADLIDRHGVVSEQCAREMAVRACELFESDWAVATTGVAGPTEQERHSVGTVYVAVAGPGVDAVEALALAGPRNDIRRGAVDEALRMLLAALAERGNAEVSNSGA